MITIRLLLQPGRPAQPVDASGRPLAVAIPGPVIGSAEPIRILFYDADLRPADPDGFAAAPALRLSIAQDLDPATTPLYVTNALLRTTTGQYDLLDPSGTRTEQAVAALGALPALPCAWEIDALDAGGDWAHPLGVVQALLPLRNRSDSLAQPATLPPVDIRGPAGADGSIGPAGPSLGASAATTAGGAYTAAPVGGRLDRVRVPSAGTSGSAASVTIPSTPSSEDATPENTAARYVLQVVPTNNVALEVVTSRGTYTFPAGSANILVEAWVVHGRNYAGQLSKTVIVSSVGELK